MKEMAEPVTLGLRLRGSRAELARAVEQFERLDEIEVLPWRPDGGWPVPFAEIAGRELLEKYVREGRLLERLRGIAGGDMAPHVHLGDEVYLLEAEVFQRLVADVARKLAAEFAGRVDYETTVDLMSQFAIDTVPLPE